MVDGAAAKNGGIILDLWHVLNLGISYDEVRRIPLQHLFGAEVNDGVFQASDGTRREPLVTRRFCGEGEFDIKGFVESVEATGYRGPWGVEVFSTDLLNRPLEELTKRAFDTAKTTLSRVLDFQL